MATVTEGKASFILGLSDLWLRFFKDRPQLDALYAGSEIVIGQAYLDLMSTILNISVRETPVFQKEFFKLLTVREDLVTLRTEDGKYIFELTDYNLKAFKFLYNKIFEPTALLEERVDFEIETEGEKDWLVFGTNPFDWTGVGDTVTGMAYRTVQVEQDDGTFAEEREIAFWIPDAQTDDFDLYLTYGYLLDHFEPSSEAYRALLQGIMQYFVKGPTIRNLTGALNVVTGLPVVRNDGEILQEVDTSDPDFQVVKTDQTNYSFDATIPLRPDILDEDNWGTLVLNAFENISDVIHVRDPISDPAWWFNQTVSTKLLPDEPPSRRVLNPNLFENAIDTPAGLIRVGDPGFIVGADDDGFIPSGRPAMRHLFSYVVFERFLRYHIFTVEIHPDVLLGTTPIPFPRLQVELQSIALPGKSAYTFMKVEPAIVISEEIRLTEETVEVGVDWGSTEAIDSAASVLRIGDRTWQIGDYYQYGPAGTLLVNQAPAPTFRFEDGKTPLAVGGTDPTHRGGLLESGSVGFFEYDGTSYLYDYSGWGNFLTSDHGRYVFRAKDETFHFIEEVTYVTILGSPVTQVRLSTVSLQRTGGGIPNEDWELWDGPARTNLADWAVQVEVTAVP